VALNKSSLFIYSLMLDIKFLEDNRHHYDLLKSAGYIKNLDLATREKLAAQAKIIDPKYVASLHCSDCVIDLIRFVYVNYEKQKAESTVKMTFPKHESKEDGQQSKVDRK
jgi:hypothetical protein